MTFKLYAHGMHPMRFFGRMRWFRDIRSFSDASGMVWVWVEPVSILTHQIHCPGFGERAVMWCTRRHCFVLR